MRAMRRGSATDNGRGDESDAGIGMLHGANGKEASPRMQLGQDQIMFDFACIFSIWLL
jgi:hypothetical protein